MIRTSTEHGVFTWSFNGIEQCYLVLATDDILFLYKTRTTFLTLRRELEKLFDLTVSEGSVLKFLNLHIVQSLAGISFDQMHHIHNNLLAKYFANVDPKSIKDATLSFSFGIFL
jgi:hypothetical protein